MATQRQQRDAREPMLDELKKRFPDAVDETTVKGEKKTKRDRFGRPTVMTLQVLQKLEQAASIGCTHDECALFAGIAPSTFSMYLKKNADFAERIEKLKDTPILAARLNVVTDITKNKNVGTSFEYLKRKRRDEFADKSELDIKAPKLIQFNDGDDD